MIASIPRPLKARFDRFVTFLAGAGVIASAGWHLVAWTGRAGMESPAFYIFIGIFPLAFYAIHAIQHTRTNSWNADWRTTVLVGAPRWVYRLIKGSFAYLVAMLILVATVLPERLEAVYFSAGSAAFYTAMWAILYARSERERLGFTEQCSNGHPVSPSARCCAACESEVAQPEVDASRFG